MKRKVVNYYSRIYTEIISIRVADAVPPPWKQSMYISPLQLRVHVLPGLQWSSQYSSQWVSGGVLLGNVQNSLFISNQRQHSITKHKTLGALRMPACKDIETYFGNVGSETSACRFLYRPAWTKVLPA